MRKMSIGSSERSKPSSVDSPPADPRWTLLPGLTGLQEHRESWDAVNRNSFASHPLLDSRFVIPLVQHFGSDKTSLAILQEGTNTIQGALLVERRAPGIWQTFLPSQAQIAPMVLPPDAEAPLRALLSALPGPCWILELLKQDREYSCLSGVLRGADEVVQARTMRIRVEDDFDRFWNARNRNLRQNVRRYLKRLGSEDIEERFLAIREADEVMNALHRYGELESKGWKGAAGTAVHPDNVQGRFYRDVMQGFAEIDKATVYELYLGNRLAASRLCIASDEMLVMLKTTYDEELSRYAPGRILLYRLIESAFRERQHQVIEFYTNATRETLQWGSEDRTIAHVTLYRNRLLQDTLHVWRQAKRSFSIEKHENNGDEHARPETGVRAEKENAAAPSSWQRVTNFDDFLALETEWKRCCELDGYRSVFLSHLWYENFIREVVSSRDQVSIFVARSNRVQAIFPMMLSSESTLRGRKLGFLANFYTPVAKPIWGVRAFEDRVALAASLLRHLAAAEVQWDTLDFTLLPQETSDFDVLIHALRQVELKHSRYSASVNWYQSTHGLTAGAYTEQLPSRVRSTIRRRLRRAEQRGRVTSKIYTSFEDVTQHMDEYYQVYARSWKRPEPYPNFHRRLAEKLAARNELLLGITYFEERPVAAQIWIIHDRTASILKLSYDEAFKEYSFGTILTHKLISFVLDQRTVDTIDYLTGDDAYKRDWMSCHRERAGIIAFNRTIRGRWIALREVFFKPTIKRVIRHRRAGNLGRSTLT